MRSLTFAALLILAPLVFSVRPALANSARTSAHVKTGKRFKTGASGSTPSFKRYSACLTAVAEDREHETFINSAGNGLWLVRLRNDVEEGDEGLEVFLVTPHSVFSRKLDSSGTDFQLVNSFFKSNGKVTVALANPETGAELQIALSRPTATSEQKQLKLSILKPKRLGAKKAQFHIQLSKVQGRSADFKDMDLAFREETRRHVELLTDTYREDLRKYKMAVSLFRFAPNGRLKPARPSVKHFNQKLAMCAGLSTTVDSLIHRSKSAIRATSMQDEWLEASVTKNLE